MCRLTSFKRRRRPLAPRGGMRTTVWMIVRQADISKVQQPPLLLMPAAWRLTFWAGTQTAKETKVGGLFVRLQRQRDKQSKLIVDETGFSPTQYWWLQIHRPAYIFHIVLALFSHFLFVLMTLMMAQCEAWGLLFPWLWTDVSAWPLMSVSHAIYHLRDWVSFLNIARWKPEIARIVSFMKPLRRCGATAAWK